MAKARMRAGLVAGWLVLFGAAVCYGAPPSVDEMLKFSPKQDGVAYATPADAEKAGCKVEAVRGQGKGAGWLLRDAKGLALRRYYDSRYDGKTKTGIDTWSYYKDGVEVYRELDSNFDGRVDQYRWLHAGGTKWGIDVNQDGKVDAWKVIAPEEVSQEALRAVVKKDMAQLQALLLTEADIKALELSAAEANRVRESLRKAAAKFQETCTKLGSLTDARWDHVEMATPQCLPAESYGLKQDLVRYTSAVVYYQVKDEAKGLQLGELIQVGTAWRLIDAPAPASLARPEEGTPAATGIVMNKEMEALYKELGDLDKAAPAADKPAELQRHNLKRADILDKMIAQVAKLDPKDYKADDRDQWVRQMADSLAVAVQNSSATDKTAAQRLTALKDKVAKDDADGSLTAYVLYCEIMADYNTRSANPSEDGPKVQKELLEKLAKFVQDHPRAENVPDALMQLGMVSELMNEEVKARNWYEMFAKNHSAHPQAAKMKGAQTRLELDGKEFVLAGPTLAGSPFDVKTLKGKAIVVYYWASWNSQCASDMEKLKSLQATHGGKGLEAVCVNLDDNPQAARTFLQGKQAPPTHLYEQGGMAGKLGEQYGIMVLPTLFLVGKDGKVINHAGQMSSLEDEIKKALN